MTKVAAWPLKKTVKAIKASNNAQNFFQIEETSSTLRSEYYLLLIKSLHNFPLSQPAFGFSIKVLHNLTTTKINSNKIKLRIQHELCINNF